MRLYEGLLRALVRLISQSSLKRALCKSMYFVLPTIYIRFGIPPYSRRSPPFAASPFWEDTPIPRSCSTRKPGTPVLSFSWVKINICYTSSAHSELLVHDEPWYLTDNSECDQLNNLMHPELLGSMLARLLLHASSAPQDVVYRSLPSTKTKDFQ